MSDERLRALERKWRETSSVEHEAAYLRERLRLELICRGRVGLAAYCGHQAAKTALGDSAPPQPEALRWWQRITLDRGRRELHRWLDGLEPFGYEACQEALGAAIDLLDDVSTGDADLGLLAVVSLANVPTPDSQLAALGELVHYLCADKGVSPAKVRAHISSRLARWTLQAGEAPTQEASGP